MGPPTQISKPAGQEHKSWKKINEERKALKRERRQDRLIREVENAEKLKELAKANQVAEAQAVRKSDPSTISIAVPGSILENAQSPELRSYLAGQIARAACIFRVNEIIVFDDIGVTTARDTKVVYDEGEDGEEITRTVRASSLQLARILQYLECPQYLRKFFFPLHKDLKYSGIMNPLDTPHHLRQQSLFLYREGIVTEKPAKEGRCFVNVGLLSDVLVDKAIKPGVRVTVKLNNVNESKKLRGIVVSPDEPRRETGVYWGYTVRIAHSLAEIFTRSTYKGGYDCTIGTSDRGSNIHEVEKSAYAYNHLLIVFGGLSGLESALANDEQLNLDDPALLFDHYLNVLPKQGSRTIRTEEALLIAMSALQEKLNPQVADIENSPLKELLPRSEDTGIKPLFEPTAQKNFKHKERNPFMKSQRNNISEDKTKAKNDNEIVHSNPFTNGFRKNHQTEHSTNTENAKSFDQSTYRNNKSNNSNHFTDKRDKSRKFRENDQDLQGPEARISNKIIKVEENVLLANESSKSNYGNPFADKKDKKRTFKENDRDMPETDKFKKSNEASKVVPFVNDDLEIVPASAFTQPARQKKSKVDLDLSRFD